MRFKTVTLAVVLFGSLLAACGGGGGTGGGSNADPVSATKLAVSYIEQKKFDAMGDAFCAAQASTIQDSLTGGASASGLDTKKILDALTIKVENLVVNEVSRTGDKAVVSMKGTMKMSADKAKFKEVVRDLLKAQGQTNPPDAVLDPIVDQAVATMAKDQAIDESAVEVVNEGGKWKVCSDITQ